MYATTPELGAPASAPVETKAVGGPFKDRNWSLGAGSHICNVSVVPDVHGQPAGDPGRDGTRTTYTTITPWSHLGLPEPETQQKVRTASVCPPCVKDERRSAVQSITVFVQDIGDGRARVYLKAF
ncbi:hypothetical protein ACIA8H_36525 [Streptomyces goshikiensis]|uniref:hypothetical protein n=1 Tax=Streptomyces goshikiensis TaxID=1942 RepID=UPI0037B4194C